MQVTRTELPEVLLVEPRVFADHRGYFLETWNQPRYEAAGLPRNLVQDNLSFSHRGVLRGLHYQHPHPQGKLVYVVAGEIFDVAVDIRQGSPNFGRWVGVTLSSENKRQLFIPEGFAHGFCVLSETALVTYKCTDIYRADSDAGIRWNDPQLGIRWPIEAAALSDKDRDAPLLAEVREDRLPRYAGVRIAAP